MPCMLRMLSMPNKDWQDQVPQNVAVPAFFPLNVARCCDVAPLLYSTLVVRVIGKRKEELPASALSSVCRNLCLLLPTSMP